MFESYMFLLCPVTSIILIFSNFGIVFHLNILATRLIYAHYNKMVGGIKNDAV